MVLTKILACEYNKIVDLLVYELYPICLIEKIVHLFSFIKEKENDTFKMISDWTTKACATKQGGINIKSTTKLNSSRKERW